MHPPPAASVAMAAIRMTTLRAKARTSHDKIIVIIREQPGGARDQLLISSRIHRQQVIDGDRLASAVGHDDIPAYLTLIGPAQ